MLRHFILASGVASLAFACVAAASAGYFIDLSALAPLNYYNAIPDGINASGAVSMQGYSSADHGTNMYYHTYLYSGGTAGTLSDLTSDFTGTTLTTGNALNGNSQMAVAGIGGGNGYLYSGGTVTSYKYGGASSTMSLAVNANGDEGGYYVNTAGSTSRTTPIVYTGGTAYALNLSAGDTDGPGAGILALNTNGQAVGFSSPATGNVQGAVWTYTISGGSVASQTATDITSSVQAKYPSALTSELWAINNSGNAVGSWCTTWTSSLGLGAIGGSFIYNVGNQSVTSLGSLLVGSTFPGSLSHGAGQSQAINDSGVVVGCIVNTANSSGYDAAIWKSGSVTDLNTLYAPALAGTGFTLDNATAIDDNGDIAGYGHDTNGNVQQAFLLRALLPGDANEDGRVDINDLTIVLSHFGQTGTTWSQGEFTGDGTVDINDLTIVLAHFGQSSGSSAGYLSAVPEPSALVLLGLGVIGWLTCAWRKRK